MALAASIERAGLGRGGGCAARRCMASGCMHVMDDRKMHDQRLKQGWSKVGQLQRKGKPSCVAGRQCKSLVPFL
jgi:hypothetical protein